MLLRDDPSRVIGEPLGSGPCLMDLLQNLLMGLSFRSGSRGDARVHDGTSCGDLNFRCLNSCVRAHYARARLDIGCGLILHLAASVSMLACSANAEPLFFSSRREPQESGLIADSEGSSPFFMRGFASSFAHSPVGRCRVFSAGGCREQPQRSPPSRGGERAFWSWRAGSCSLALGCGLVIDPLLCFSHLGAPRRPGGSVSATMASQSQYVRLGCCRRQLLWGPRISNTWTLR